jgi:hypothetical protein
VDGDRHRLAGVERALAADPVLDRLAVDELHHDVQEPEPVRREVVDPDEVLVVQPGGLLGLLAEPGDGLRAVLGVPAPLEHLDRDLDLQVQVEPAVDGGHPALGQLLDEHGRLEHLVPVDRRHVAEVRILVRGSGHRLGGRHGRGDSITRAHTGTRRPRDERVGTRHPGILSTVGGRVRPNQMGSKGKGLGPIAGSRTFVVPLAPSVRGANRSEEQDVGRYCHPTTTGWLNSLCAARRAVRRTSRVARGR